MVPWFGGQMTVRVIDKFSGVLESHDGDFRVGERAMRGFMTPDDRLSVKRYPDGRVLFTAVTAWGEELDIVVTVS